ncbi:MAG: M15 family metallopeptidase [Desulfuromonadales bacterium]|nr:M15 family metallopeptidase [Desulfuromonadales bacterium]
MPKFSAKSMSILETCRPELQKLCLEVVKTFDCSVISGRRGQLEQEKLFKDGKSNAHWGESPHNYGESFAVDVIPYPVNWEETDRFALFAGYVLRTAEEMGIELKWGGDWDRDYHLSDNRFDDLPHFELVGWREKVRAH